MITDGVSSYSWLKKYVSSVDPSIIDPEFLI